MPQVQRQAVDRGPERRAKTGHGRLYHPANEALVRHDHRGRNPRIQGRQDSPGHRGRQPGQQLPQLHHPDRHPDGGLFVNPVLPALPLQQADQERLRIPRHAPVGPAIRLPGTDHQEGGRRRQGRSHEQAPDQPGTAAQGEAGPGAGRNPAHTAQHRLHKTPRRGRRPARLRGKTAAGPYGRIGRQRGRRQPGGGSRQRGGYCHNGARRGQQGRRTGRLHPR